MVGAGADLALARSEREPDDSLTALAPRPTTLEETGLDISFLTDLLAKHLYEGGVLDLRQIGQRSALSGPIVERVLQHMRGEALIEVRRAKDGGVAVRYALTERGREAALDAVMRNGYIGPAPVPLAEFVRLIRAQSVHKGAITRSKMREALADVVLPDDLVDQLGPAVNSGRPIFLYGAPGTGKSYVSRQIARLLGGGVLLPYAVSVDDTVVQYYDPLLHRALPETTVGPPFKLDSGHDPRLLACERPFVVTGGELTMDMLEVRYEPATKQYVAPLQLKASNGMFLIDDLGRQRVAIVDLLNRWILPMEEQRDYLSLGGGKHFEVPFDVVLVFSTNLDPRDLADEAFMRRLGYKIHFQPLDVERYEAIWRQVCETNDVKLDPGVFRYLVDHLHGENGVPLLPCHPRDLLGLALDQCAYTEKPRLLSSALLESVWGSYFIGHASEPVDDTGRLRPGESR